MIVLLFATASATCPTPMRTDELLADLSRAESAYVAMDLTAFQSAADAARAALPCLIDTLLPPDAAAYHRFVALDAYVQQDSAGTVAAFRASSAIQPAYVLPATLAPQGNPLEALWQAAKNQPSAPGIVLVPPIGHFALVDGARASVRPVDRPAILQLTSSDGAIRWTGWVAAGASAPDWSGFGAPMPEEQIAVEGRLSATRRPTVLLAIGAGAAGALAAGLYGGALASRAEYDNGPLDDADALRARTNGLVYGAGGIGVVAVGLLTATLLTVEW